MDMSPAGTQFVGFRSPNYTMVPDEVFDELMAGLSGAELKVLLYIIRRTFGFKKQSDDISLNQICQGIRIKGGRALDHGTGLSRSTVKVALQALLAKNVIIAAHRASAEHGFEATTFRLNVTPEPVQVLDPPGPKIGLAPYAENRPSPGPDSGLALGRKSALQETVVQETESDLDSMAQPHRRHASGNPATATCSRKAQPIDARLENIPSAHRPVSIGLLNESTSLLPPPTTMTIDADKAGSQTQTLSVDGGDKQLAAAHPALVEAISALCTELGDDAPLGSSIAQAHTLFQLSGLSVGAFLALLVEAAERTRAHRVTITKRRQGDVGTNALPYFFAVLRQLPELYSDRPSQASRARLPSRGRTNATGKEDWSTNRYSGGSYGVCPRCLCSPCDPECRTRKEDASADSVPVADDSS